jgi:hypothetical protein
MSDDRYKMLLRIPRDMAAEMFEEARRNGIGRTAMITTLMREALDARMARRERLVAVELELAKHH